MNILVIAEIDFPEGMAATAHISLMVKGILKNNYSSLLIIPSKSFNLKKSGKSFKNNKGKHNDIPYLFFNNRGLSNKKKFTFNSLRNVLDIAKFLKKRRKQNYNDAILIYSTDFLKYFPIYFVCRKYKIPLFPWEVEKRTSNKEIHSFRSILQFIGNYMSEKILPKISNGVVVISSYLKDYYGRRIDKSRILVSPILVDGKSPEKKINIEEKNNIYKFICHNKTNHKIIVYSGSFWEKDGFVYILHALKKLIRDYPDTRLVTTGKPSKYNPIENIISVVDEMGLKENFEYLGLLSRKELEYVNKNADLLLVCRSNSDFAKHGFPWKLGEYLMTKNPVLATRVGDIEEYLSENKEIILTEPEDVESIYCKMKEIFDDYDRAKHIALNGYKKALAVFDYSKGTKKVIDFIIKNSNLSRKKEID
jgi:glycosyltransferase involved in cell wall biosynthesis